MRTCELRFKFIERCYFLSLAFDVREQTQGGHGISLSGPQTSRTPAAPARAPPRPGERGVTVWDYESSMLSPVIFSVLHWARVDSAWYGTCNMWLTFVRTHPMVLGGLLTNSPDLLWFAGLR